jgi:hypothetical protein
MTISLYHHNSQVTINHADDWSPLTDCFINILHNYYSADHLFTEYWDRAAWFLAVMDCTEDEYRCLKFGDNPDHPEFMVEMWPTRFPTEVILTKAPF